MKVLVVGANGKVARHFADFTKEDSAIEEIAMIRKAEQVSFFEERGIETVLLDLVKNSVDELADAMKNVDAVIFSAGAGGSGLDKTILIDLDGAIKAMTAAEQAGVKRFVMVSTFRTGREAMSQETPARDEDDDVRWQLSAIQAELPTKHQEPHVFALRQLLRLFVYITVSLRRHYYPHCCLVLLYIH